MARDGMRCDTDLTDGNGLLSGRTACAVQLRATLRVADDAVKNGLYDWLIDRSA
jgi:hypothetical protein